MSARLSGADVRARRLGMGMSQKQLAAELGVTATTVARWERGERTVSNAVLVRLALDHLAARSAAAIRPDQLPAPVTPLIGRDRERAEVASLLADPQVRLLTLTGPGGSGKTALALAVLRSAATERSDGARLVELADLPAGAPVAEICAAVTTALGLRETRGEPFAQTLARALKHSDALVLVDNCEHVAAAIGDLISLLVARCPHLTVLATSREPLRIRAERRFPVAPLRLPDLTRLPPSAALRRVPAVNLFTARWSAVHPGFRLTSGQAHAVAEICVRLDGLPLALELAAAHARQASPAALLQRLDSLGDFAGPGHRDWPRRHGSLRAMLDWSYDLLDPYSQTVFRRLGVFAGGFDQQAAAEVVPDDTGNPTEVSRAIDILIDANLVTCPAARDEGHRLRLLQTVRAHARDCLIAAGELDQTARRHMMWLIRWTEAGAAKFENDQQLAWLHDLEAEIGNLRAALAWSRSPAGAEDQLGALLAASSRPSAARLYALIELGGLAVSREDAAAIERYAKEAGQIAEQRGDLRGAANVSELLTYVAFLRGDLARARELADRSLDQAIQANHPLAVAHARMARGVAAFGSGDLDTAAADLGHALDHARSDSDSWFVGECGSVLSHVHLARGNYQSARATEAESLAARVALKNRPGMAVNLKIIGITDAATGNAARAAVLFGGAAGIEETTAETWQRHWLDAYHHAVAASRDALGPRFAELWDFGKAMAEAEVIKIALVSPHAAALPGQAASRARHRGGPLTPRETQVSELIAEGLTSREIAVRLGITRRTAEAHAEHIMTKLGFRSRAQVAAWVERRRPGRIAGPR